MITKWKGRLTMGGLVDLTISDEFTTETKSADTRFDYGLSLRRYQGMLTIATRLSPRNSNAVFSQVAR